MAKEKRRSQRIEINEPGTISWQAEDGNMLGEKIQMLNLGDDGAMIEMTRRLPMRQTVQFKVPSWEIDGSASVRYCRQRGLKYRIGLELFHAISVKPKVQRWT
jgi:hypothetical protein